ncbi:MAG: hypothetical protein H6975_04670 [Gammaproteobacteria bacterium]|nr:hypothetical protein [Gammaproteobacteria bacterium]
MEATDNPFRKAGIMLLMIGILDIGAMIYCIANKISYSSSFNIFAVIVGVLLIRGSVKTARVIRWLSVFFVITFIGMMLLLLIITPLQLLVTQIKLNPVGMLNYYAFSLILIGILIWVYMQLSTLNSLAKLEQAGYQNGKPKSALYAAICLIILGSLMFEILFNSESADKAKAFAKEQLGSNYKYHISSLIISGNNGSAVVTAYNSNEIRNIQVKW